MISSQIQALLPKIQQCLASQPIEKAWLFGSCSRGEEQNNSDIDILVRYTDSDSMSLMKICKIMFILEDSLNRKVDLVEEGRLIPAAVENVNKDRLLIYERTH